MGTRQLATLDEVHTRFCSTSRQLSEALREAWRSDCFTLIDIALERGDLSLIPRGFVQAFKKQVDAS